MLANLLGGFIIVLVGVNLIPTVADSIYLATHNGSGADVTNISSTSITILNLTTIFFALGIMSSAVAIAVQGLRNAGMI